MYWDRLLISDNYVFLLLMKFMTVYWSHENLARLLLARRRDTFEAFWLIVG